MNTDHAIQVVPDKSENVCLYDIAYFSRHDGPGIRTVVYFQGCNARCDWCHSPHSQAQYSPLIYTSNACTGCQRCTVCAHGVHSFHPEHRIDRTRCVRCGTCIEQCPQSMKEKKGSALHLPATTLPVASLFRQIETSIRLCGQGGGITLSGGEALLQPAAARELLLYCRQAGIHTAVETSGLLAAGVYMAFAPLVDLWLFGMRVITGKDAARHDAHIDHVLGRLRSVHADILPRIPMVPGFFDQADVLDRITGILRNHAIHTVCLNPWNTCYDVHYLRAGIPLRMPAPTTDEIARCAHTLTTTFIHLNFTIL